MFLKISQNSQEKTCPGVTFIKEEALARVSSWEFCEIFKNICEFHKQNVNTFSQWAYVEWAWARFVKLFTCDYALDIVIVLLMLQHLFWDFVSVLMGLNKYLPTVYYPNSCVNKEDGAKYVPKQVFRFIFPSFPK